MKGILSGAHQTESGGGTAALAVVLVIQALAAVFFVGDVLADLTFETFDVHILLEAFVAFALALGVIANAREMGRTIERARRAEQAVRTARGALSEVIEAQFARWGLSPAEADVAMLALKGLDTAAIAALRATAPGTVRAQLANVYGKAGLSSRAELISLFMDELLDAPLIDRPTS